MDCLVGTETDWKQLYGANFRVLIANLLHLSLEGLAIGMCEVLQSIEVDTG